MKHFVVAFLLSCFTILSLSATVLNVPAGYPTIQAGINAAQDGDMVLVEPGTYYENINFRGKNITVTSNYINDHDIATILETVIDGSQSIEPDSGSVVLFINGEDSTAVINGFTITGGTGTKWQYEHGGTVNRAGGGIFATLSSPTISNNLIIDNEAILVYDNIYTSGGGGIRVGDGTPRILNNVIANNRGMYCGGLDLNYTGALIRNNIIANNRVYQAVPNTVTYGGGGLCAYMNYQSIPVTLENNTITGNVATGGFSGAAGRGGGLMAWQTHMIMRNNIVQGNNQERGGGIHVISSNLETTYCCLDEMRDGEGNIIDLALFADSLLQLSPDSPCVDAGNPGPGYNDPGDPAQPGFALFPSCGTVRNDMGAYGGPVAMLLAVRNLNGWYCPESLNLHTTALGQTRTFKLPVTNRSDRPWTITGVSTTNPHLMYDSIGPEVRIPPMERDSLQFILEPDTEGVQADTIYIHHSNPNVGTPIEVVLSYNAVANDDETSPEIPLLSDFSVYPNPFNPRTMIRFALARETRVRVRVYNVQGQLVDELCDGPQSPGIHTLAWNGTQGNRPLASGVYYCRIDGEGIDQTRKLMLIK